MRRLIFLSVFFSVFAVKAGTPSIIFKENKGQWPDKVLFGTEFLNTKFYVNKTSFNYCVYNYEDLLKAHENHNSEDNTTIIHGHNYEVNFINADFTGASKKEEQHEYYNYFLGNDKSKWASSVKAFKNLLFTEIYKGIDLNLYSAGINLKYDFVVTPNANCNLIKLNYKDVDGIEIKNNELLIKTSVGEIIEKTPLAYQIINGRRVEVKCKYSLSGENTIGFSFPNGYNKNYELIIDPVVVVCSYSGSTIWSDNYSCTYDSQGNIYDAGDSSPGYPTSIGAFQITGKKFMDIIISKYDDVGSSKYFSTYIGGDSTDFPLEILVKNNEITLMGITVSKNFPTTNSAYDTTYNGYDDFIFSKFNMSGTVLLGSTYIGGNANDGYNPLTLNAWDRKAGEFVCDTSGNVYIISSTNSANFPIVAGAISPVKKGNYDAVIFKLNKNLSSLVYSTFMGGNISESGKAIRLDGTGGVYCFGSTTSPNFPTKPGAISTTRSGSTDFYIIHLNSNATAIIASTYLGTGTNDFANLMDLDLNNNIYLCGNFMDPILLNPTPGTYNNAIGYNSIYKINSGLSNILFQTKFGNYTAGVNQYLNFTAFNVDSCMNVYVAGFGDNTFPTTPDEFQSYGGGPADMYVALFNPNCSSLKFASFYGGPITNFSSGEHVDGGISHFSDKGYLYQAICSSGGLPTTANAYAPNFVNTTTNTVIYNEAIWKVDFRTFVDAHSSYGGNIIACPPYTATFVSTTNTGSTIWDFGDASPLDTNKTIIHPYPFLGVYDILLVVTDTNTCNRTDSIKTKLSVIPPTAFDLGPDKQICLNGNLLLKSNVSAVSYTWSSGQNTPNITITNPGLYQLIINNGGCESSDIVNVKIGEPDFDGIFPNVITPNNDGVNDKIDFTKYNLGEMEFFIYDRWGTERFKSTDVTDYWDARQYDEGTYFYVVNYKSTCTGKTKTQKGFISLFK